MLRAAVLLIVWVLPVQPGAPRRVLFIGNSLTLANGLPQMVEALARGSGTPIEIGVVTRPGFSLDDHWHDGGARRAIVEARWDLVVLQQGPSSQPDSRRLLRESVSRFDRESRKRGATVALYMVWPPRSGPGTFTQVRESYARAAADVRGLLLPVGDAIRAALASDPPMPVLGPDGFHPTPLGTLLAALVITHGITGHPPVVPRSLASSTHAFPPITISDEMAAQLRQAAAAVRR